MDHSPKITFSFVDRNDSPRQDSTKSQVETNAAPQSNGVSELRVGVVMEEESSTDCFSPNYHLNLSEALNGLTIPQGIVGKEYVFKIELPRDYKRSKHTRVCVESDPLFKRDLNLNVDFDEDRAILTIRGVPKRSFSGRLRLYTEYRRKGFAPAKRSEYPYDFSILDDDPWSLWLDKPSPDGPYPTPDRKFAFEAIPYYKNDKRLVVLAASQRGRSHAHVGLFRDDDFAFRVYKKPETDVGAPNKGWSVFVVADGAGSARFSRKGAQIVCETIVEKLDAILNGAGNRESLASVEAEIKKIVLQENRFKQSLAKTESIVNTKLDQAFCLAVRDAYAAIQAEAKTKNDEEKSKLDQRDEKRADAPVSMRDYNTTALCLALKRFVVPREDDKKTIAVWAIATYWIGDGGIVVYRPGGEETSILMGTPDGGEYAGETRFITTSKDDCELEKVRARTRLLVARNFEAIYLASDGATDPFFEVEKDLQNCDKQKEFMTTFVPKWFPGVFDVDKSLEERAKALLDGMMFKVKGNHDDRTAVLILNDEMRNKDVRSSNE